MLTCLSEEGVRKAWCGVGRHRSEAGLGKRKQPCLPVPRARPAPEPARLLRPVKHRSLDVSPGGRLLCGCPLGINLQMWAVGLGSPRQVLLRTEM